MYDPKSSRAEEFISHEEVLETLEFAEKSKNNTELIDSILKRRNFEKDLPTGRLRFWLPVRFVKKMKRYLNLPDKSKMIFTATA